MIGPLVIYFIFLIVYWIFSAIMFYHLKEFEYAGDACKPMRVAYTITSITIIIFTLVFTLIAGGINA